MTHTTGEFDLAAMMRELLAENDRLRALVDALVERCAGQSEALSRRAEAPVPRPLFEAAVAMMKGTADRAIALAVDTERRRGETFLGTAERLIRRAAACGVGEEAK